jgi:hypothetical protein
MISPVNVLLSFGAAKAHGGENKGRHYAHSNFLHCLPPVMFYPGNLPVNLKIRSNAVQNCSPKVRASRKKCKTTTQPSKQQYDEQDRE